MLRTAPVFAYAPVKNIEAGRAFYEGKLGFTPESEVPGVGVTYQCGNGTAFFMYLSDGAGTNKASTLFWVVDDLETEVKELRNAGVEMINYDYPDFKTVDGIVQTPDGNQAAWFADPDGNVLAIINS
jgi:catechol 2,3-dioxygenase-like lactoylglutathione lyase family enzyme